MQQPFVQPSLCIRLGSLVDSRGEMMAYAREKMTNCYAQDHVQQQMMIIHVMEITTCNLFYIQQPIWVLIKQQKHLGNGEMEDDSTKGGGRARKQWG